MELARAPAHSSNGLASAVPALAFVLGLASAASALASVFAKVVVGQQGTRGFGWWVHV